MPLDFLFGRRKTPQEMLRQNQRALNRAMRDLDRERGQLENQEKRIIADIKKMAQKGEMDSVKIMAKDLVRTRRYVKKFMLMRANIQAVALKIQTLKSQDTMAQAMKGVTKAMMAMNKQLKLPQIQKIMQEFEKQSEIMDMKEEMMSDAIDDAMADEGDEEESEQIVTQVLDELGIQLTDELSNLPAANSTLNPAAASAAARKAQVVGGGGGGAGIGGAGAGGAGNGGGGGGGGGVSDADADLEARLANLRRN